MRENVTWPLRSHAMVVADATHWTLNVQIHPPDARDSPEFLRLAADRVIEIAGALPAAAAQFRAVKAAAGPTDHFTRTGPGGIRLRVNAADEGLCIAPCRWEFGTTLYDLDRLGDLVAALNGAATRGTRMVELCRSAVPG
jgi:hypothetical protein